MNKVQDLPAPKEKGAGVRSLVKAGYKLTRRPFLEYVQSRGGECSKEDALRWIATTTKSEQLLWSGALYKHRSIKVDIKKGRKLRSETSREIVAFVGNGSRLSEASKNKCLTAGAKGMLEYLKKSICPRYASFSEEKGFRLNENYSKDLHKRRGGSLVYDVAGLLNEKGSASVEELAEGTDAPLISVYNSLAHLRRMGKAVVVAQSPAGRFHAVWSLASSKATEGK